MNLSYREMSIWLHIVIITVIYGLYFSLFARAAMTDNLAGGQWIGLLIVATIVVIFAETISQGILALFNQKSTNQALDERDRQFQSKATQISHYTLIAGLWVGLSSIFISNSPFFMFNVIFFFFIVGELIGYFSQAISYRRTA